MGGTALTFEVDGEVHYRGTLSNYIVKSFHVSVDNCRWSITTWSGSNSVRLNAVSAIFDGTNVSMITRFDGEVPKGIPRRRGGKFEIVPQEPRKGVVIKNTGAVSVIPGQVPEFDASFAAPIWFMFTSGCVLDGLGKEGVLKPMWINPPDDTNEAAYGEWERSPEFPRFPTNAVFKSSPDGPVRASFVSSGFQRKGDAEFPTFGKLTQFASNPNPRNKILTVTEVKVREISITDTIVLPSVPSNSIITDRRLRVGPRNEPSVFFSYFSSNGEIADPERMKQTTRFRMEASTRREKIQNYRTRRYVVLGALCISSLVLAAYYLLSGKNPRKESVKERKQK